MRSRLALSTAYSLLFSPVAVDDLFDRLQAMQVEQVAITDRDNLYGYPVYREAAKERGISLVCACLLTERQGDLFAFVQDQKGYELLCTLISKRNLDPTFSYLPTLKKTSEGLVLATTSSAILSQLADTGAALYGAISPDSLQIITTAKKLTVPLLAIDGAFLLEEGQREVHRVLRAIALHKSVGSLTEEAYIQKGGILLRQEEWEQAFAPWPEAIEHAQILIPYDPFSSSLIFPTYPVTAQGSAEEELKNRVYLGAENRYGEINDAIMERIDYELGIINEKGFAPYFLVMHDIVQMSSRTCGRGSGAASIVSYSLFITNVDPIAHHLYFERFLSPSRQDPPDIDVDFAWDERDGVFAAVFERFGIEHCARVANHNRFRLRSAIRETARCYGLSDAQITKAEETLFMKGIDALLDPLWQTIVRIATALDRLPKEISMHCGGLVITPKEITRYAPILRSADGYPLLSWEKEGTEMAGFVKIDLLGNRSLAVIRDTLQNLWEEGVSLDERTWQPAEDDETVNALARGDSMGVFYIESPAMRQLQKKTGRGDFAHIVIHSSLIRPAANKYINEYVQRLKGKRWEPLHPRLAYILDETYGILCYQEDVSKTAVALAGFSQADADQLRKIIAKKADGKRLQVFRDQFFAGCEKNGVNPSVAEQIWLMMLSFDGYSFCKPHSASYAMVSFQSAYLRVHHPAHFMAAVLTNQGGYYRPQAYISEARRMGLTLTGPDINTSRIAYWAEGNTLIIGLMAIAELSRNAMKRIIEERKQGGWFSTLEEASHRLALGREDLVALVASGAFDSLAPARKRSDQLRILLTTTRSHSCNGQADLFSIEQPHYKKEQLPVAIQRPYSEGELHREFASLGFLRNHHPLVLYAHLLSSVHRIKACEIDQNVERYVTLIGYQITQKQVLTKTGECMSFVSFEDETALYETVLFPELYKRLYPLLAGRWPLLVFGLVKNDEGALIVEVQNLRKLGS